MELIQSSVMLVFCDGYFTEDIPCLIDVSITAENGFMATVETLRVTFIK